MTNNQGPYSCPSVTPLILLLLKVICSIRCFKIVKKKILFFFFCRNSPSFKSFEEKVENTVSTIKVNIVFVSLFALLSNDK